MPTFAHSYADTFRQLEEEMKEGPKYMIPWPPSYQGFETPSEGFLLVSADATTAMFWVRDLDGFLRHYPAAEEDRTMAGSISSIAAEYGYPTPAIEQGKLEIDRVLGIRAKCLGKGCGEILFRLPPPSGWPLIAPDESTLRKILKARKGRDLVGERQERLRFMDGIGQALGLYEIGS